MGNVLSWLAVHWAAVLLFALGVWGWATAVKLQKDEMSRLQEAREAIKQAGPELKAQGLDPEAIAKVIEALGGVLESLTKFGRPIQWALVSLVPLAMAAYLLKP